LERTEEEQISTTDADARAVVLHRNIVNVGYNIQASSDGKHKMIIGLDTGDVNDTHALSGMVEITQNNLGKKVKNVLADKGYHTAQELWKCEQLGVSTYVSPKESAVSKRLEVFSVSEFKYHPGSDTYRCPADKIMRSNNNYYLRKSKKKNAEPIRFKQYKTSACKTCPIRKDCTNSKNGRMIQRLEHQGSIDRNNKRVHSNPEYYKQRQQIIEHQFDDRMVASAIKGRKPTFKMKEPYHQMRVGGKRQRGFTHVLLRGKEKVLGEASILFTMYNLGRCMSILGFSDLIRLLERLKCGFYCIFDLRLLRAAYRNEIINELSAA